MEFCCSESVPWGWSLANMLVFKKVREALGFQRCKGFGVGAAPIKMETLEYFMSLNIPIRPTYGRSSLLTLGEHAQRGLQSVFCVSAFFLAGHKAAYKRYQWIQTT